MRLILRFTLVLFGASVVLMVGMLMVRRANAPENVWLAYNVDKSLYRMNEQTRVVSKVMDYGSDFVTDNAVSLDRTWLLFGQREGQNRYASNLYLVNLGGVKHQLTNLPGREEFQTFSPDGRWVYFTNRDGMATSLYRVDITGQGLEKIRDMQPERDDLIQGWSPDGQWMYVGLNADPDQGVASDIARMRPDGSDVQILTNPQAAYDYWFLGFTPDHEHVLIQRIGWNLQTSIYRATADLKMMVQIAQEGYYMTFYANHFDANGWLYYVSWDYSNTPFRWQLKRLNWLTGESQALTYPMTYYADQPLGLAYIGEWLYYSTTSSECFDDGTRSEPKCYNDLHRVRLDGAYSGRVAALHGDEINLVATPHAIYFQAGDSEHGYPRLYRLNPQTLETQLIMEVTDRPYFSLKDWMRFPDHDWQPAHLALLGLGVWGIGVLVGLRRRGASCDFC